MVGQRLLYLFGGTLLTLLLQRAVGFLGPLGVLFSLLVPLPAALSGMRQGMVTAGGIVLATATVLAGSSGAAHSAAYLLQFGLGSFVLPLLLRRGWPWDRAVAAVVLTVSAVAALTLVTYVGARDVTIGELISRYVQEETTRATALYQEAGLTADQLQELQSLTRQMADFLLRAWPALAMAAVGLVQLLTVLVIRLAGKGYYPAPEPPFRAWKAPDLLIWGLIAGGAGLLLAGGLAERVALNLLVIVLPIYFLQGLAIVHFYFWKRQVAPFFRNFGYLLIMIFNPLPLLVTGLGVFDLWIDFRKPRVKE